ncbi:aminotransferase class IV [Pontibacter sp. JH31]|uniref:branched-chain-amino-acid transaminase n=1 Tax=Pontibacter aquaedesilientis TaxID=2766980 RepID=A0ABR7XFI2_9BACT|nr:aminotransferase class IV [Pontibacter aquaedesilientis]MBD1396161.1 aminotransferase class IV [Pontibacter aquaedesilientis]
MLLYNNQFLPAQDLRIPLHNRAFQYNDSFFETIMVVDGRLRFWNEHKTRMREAALAMKISLPDYFWDEELEDNLLRLAKQRNATRRGRIKLKVWRAGEGLYTPQTRDAEWLATAEVHHPAPDAGVRIGICETVRISYSPFSHFKGPHAPFYVLASMEKQAKGFDDMLLLNVEGYMSELSSSNLFWLREGVLYTPHLETGCVNGILRRKILNWCHEQEFAVQQVQAKPDELLFASVVFGSNVTGIRSVLSLGNSALHVDHQFLNQLKARLGF